MSFVQKLRMNNIFPTGGMNLGYSGQLPSYGGSDPLQEILDIYDSRSRNFNDAPVGLQRVASRNIGKSDDENGPLKFGGYRHDGDSNPGRDILNRSKLSAERTYAGYSEPQTTAGELLRKAGIKPNEQFPGFEDSVDIDKQLDREGKRASIDATRQRIQQGERRLSIAEHRAKNPNLKFIPVKGGNIMSFNPQTGESEDTGVATNTLSESDRIKMQQDFAMRKQDDAQAANAEKPATATQQGHAVTNRIKEAINRNPTWADFINAETGMVAPVGTGSSMWSGNKGLDEATRKTILDTIYGPPAMPTTQVNVPANTPTNTTPAAPTGPVTSERIRIQMPDGTKGMWRADKPLPQGAVRIQ